MSRFPCLWCGEDSPTRAALEGHWLVNPACGRNRTVSNGYQPGSHAFGERPVMPGEHTLRLVQTQQRRHRDDG